MTFRVTGKLTPFYRVQRKVCNPNITAVSLLFRTPTHHSRSSQTNPKPRPPRLSRDLFQPLVYYRTAGSHCRNTHIHSLTHLQWTTAPNLPFRASLAVRSEHHKATSKQNVAVATCGTTGFSEGSREYKKGVPLPVDRSVRIPLPPTNPRHSPPA